MLRSKSRAARRRKLRKLGGRLELPSNVATKELGPFPRYPPESWVIIIYWFPYPILLNLQNLSKSIKIYQSFNFQIFKSLNLQIFKSSNLQSSMFFFFFPKPYICPSSFQLVLFSSNNRGYIFVPYFLLFWFIQSTKSTQQ